MTARAPFWPGIGPVRALGPGFYVDRLGNVHIETGEVLGALAQEDTPGNRERVVRALTGQLTAGHVQQFLTSGAGR